MTGPTITPIVTQPDRPPIPATIGRAIDIPLDLSYIETRKAMDPTGDVELVLANAPYISIQTNPANRSIRAEVLLPRPMLYGYFAMTFHGLGGMIRCSRKYGTG